MPPPSAAVGDLFTVIHPQYISPQVGEVTVGYAVAATTGTSATYQEIIDQLDTNWRGSGLRALACDSVTFEKSRLYVLDPATGLATQIAVTANGESNGTSTLGLCPYQAAAVVKKQTPRAGRSGRGRFYHPFLILSALTFVGELAAAFITSLNNAISTWFQAVTPITVGSGGNTATVAPVIIHRSPLPLTSDPITTIACTGSIGTQKRRGDYGRTNRAS